MENNFIQMAASAGHVVAYTMFQPERERERDVALLLLRFYTNATTYRLNFNNVNIIYRNICDYFTRHCFLRCNTIYPANMFFQFRISFRNLS